MPNYILSRTSPPAHIYERKINLGYGIKVDTSDAPTNQAQKGKEMNNAKEVLDVADNAGNGESVRRIDGAAFADGTVFTNRLANDDEIADLEAKATEEVKDVNDGPYHGDGPYANE